MGCLKCDECYNLVQTQANKLRQQISTLDANLARVIPETSSPETLRKNAELQLKLGLVRAKIEALHGSLFSRGDLIASKSYGEALQSADRDIAKIKLDFRDLQPVFDDFENKLIDFGSLDIRLNKTMDDARLVLTPLSQNQDQFQFQLAEVNQSLSKQSISANSLRLKGAAARGRQAAEEQIGRAKNLANLMDDNAESARTALDYLNELIEELEHTQTEDVDYDVMSRSAAKLGDKAAQLTADLSKSVKESDEATRRLKQLNLNEKKVDDDVKALNAKTDEFSTKVIFSNIHIFRWTCFIID